MQYSPPVPILIPSVAVAHIMFISPAGVAFSIDLFWETPPR